MNDDTTKELEFKDNENLEEKGKLNHNLEQDCNFLNKICKSF